MLRTSRKDFPNKLLVATEPHFELWGCEMSQLAGLETEGIDSFSFELNAWRSLLRCYATYGD